MISSTISTDWPNLDDEKALEGQDYHKHEPVRFPNNRLEESARASDISMGRFHETWKRRKMLDV
jgi:hypothetical protein